MQQPHDSHTGSSRAASLKVTDSQVSQYIFAMKYTASKEVTPIYCLLPTWRFGGGLLDVLLGALLRGFPGDFFGDGLGDNDRDVWAFGDADGVALGGGVLATAEVLVLWLRPGAAGVLFSLWG